MKEFNEVRDFGEILIDPLRIIFRNLKEISSLVIFAVVLPNVIVTYMYLKFSVFDSFNIAANNDLFPQYKISIISIVLFFVVGFIMYNHISLISACLLRVGTEEGQHNIKAQKVTKYFKKLYMKNLAITVILIVTIVVFYGVGIGLIFNEVFALGSMLFLLGVIFLFLYLMPLFFYSQRYYLFNDINLMQAIKNGQSDLYDFYGNTIGVLFVGSIVSSFLQYMILIPFMILFMVLGFAINFEFESNQNTNIIVFVQSLFLGVGLAYLYLYFYVMIYLKGNDLEERKTGEALIKRINQIDISRKTFFENEGEY